METLEIENLTYKRSFAIVDFECFAPSKPAISEGTVMIFNYPDGIKHLYTGHLPVPSLDQEDLKQWNYIKSKKIYELTDSDTTEIEMAKAFCKFLKFSDGVCYANDPTLENKIFRKWMDEYSGEPWIIKLVALDLFELTQLIKEHNLFHREFKQTGIRILNDLWRAEMHGRCELHKLIYTNNSGHCSQQDCFVIGYSYLLMLLEYYHSKTEIIISPAWVRELPFSHCSHNIYTNPKKLNYMLTSPPDDLEVPLVIIPKKVHGHRFLRGFYLTKHDRVKEIDPDIMIEYCISNGKLSSSTGHMYSTGYFIKGEFVEYFFKKDVYHQFSEAEYKCIPFSELLDNWFPNRCEVREVPSGKLYVKEGRQFYLTERGNKGHTTRVNMVGPLGLIEIFFN